MNSPRLLLASLVFAVAGPLAGAQTAAPQLAFPPASPKAVVKQTVGLTDIEVAYQRPAMKGRTIFGGLVPYDKIWRTGADTATKITFSTPVKLNGTALSAGTYELFTIPGKSEWTVVIHQNKSQWGSYAYDAKNDVARVKAAPVALPNAIESFSIGFADLKPAAATLYFAWEKTRVPVKIEVDLVGQMVPQIEAAMAASGTEKKPYFAAAMFYYENNLDLKKALAWLDAGLAEQPKAYWMIYRKGLVLAKAGDKAGAAAAAKKSLEVVAAEGKGELLEEYTRLNNMLLASLK